MNSLSPLQLKQHFFPRVSVFANPNGTQAGKSNLSQQISYSPTEGVPNTWNLEIQIKQESADLQNPFFYEIEIFVIGTVEFFGDAEPQKKEMIATVNGLGLLYSACREMIINITARSAYGPMSLPAQNFAEAIKQARTNLPQQSAAVESPK